MSKNIVYPTFKDAQKLYSAYSTLENISVLKDMLFRTLDPTYLSTVIEKNIHEIYNQIILKYYPNEISIKSSFINQVLINEKNQVTIFELPVSSSRTDLCKINGTSVAYEIKTDLDNYSRLEKQINDYYKLFEKVYVICSSNNCDNLAGLIPDTCGIYTYSQNRLGNYKYNCVRTAEEIHKYDPSVQLHALQKKELQEYFHLTIKERNELEATILNSYSADSINTAFKGIIKQRFQKQWDFLYAHHKNIFEIDYQWFYKNQVEPSRIYV